MQDVDFADGMTYKTAFFSPKICFVADTVVSNFAPIFLDKLSNKIDENKMDKTLYNG